LMPTVLFDSWGIPKSLQRCRIELDNAEGDTDLKSAMAMESSVLSESTDAKNLPMDEHSDLDNPPDNNNLERWYLA